MEPFNIFLLIFFISEIIWMIFIAFFPLRKTLRIYPKDETTKFPDYHEIKRHFKPSENEAESFHDALSDTVEIVAVCGGGEFFREPLFPALKAEAKKPRKDIKLSLILSDLNPEEIKKAQGLIEEGSHVGIYQVPFYPRLHFTIHTTASGSHHVYVQNVHRPRKGNKFYYFKRNDDTLAKKLIYRFNAILSQEFCKKIPLG